MRQLLAVLMLLVSMQTYAGEPGMPISIEEVKSNYTNQLLALPGVVSVGIGKDAHNNLAIIVGLDVSRPDTEAQIPENLEGYPVEIRIIGPVKAH